eukprot:7669170-Pyramimonas_sp.AAC.1
MGRLRRGPVGTSPGCPKAFWSYPRCGLGSLVPTWCRLAGLFGPIFGDHSPGRPSLIAPRSRRHCVGTGIRLCSSLASRTSPGDLYRRLGALSGPS